MTRGRTTALCVLAAGRRIDRSRRGRRRPPAPTPTTTPPQRAAREIAAARDQANAAAAAFFDAQSELEQLGDQAAELAAENAQLQQEVDALQAQVEQVAVNRFVASSSAGIPLLTGYQEPSDQLQAGVLVDVATESSADSMDAYDQARTDLEANQEEVAANQAAVEDKQEQFLALQAAAEKEVERLQAVEAKRLEDERVREALEAQRREEQRQREAEEAAAAAAPGRGARRCRCGRGRRCCGRRRLGRRRASTGRRPGRSPRRLAVRRPTRRRRRRRRRLPATTTTRGAPARARCAAAPVSGIICPVAGSAAYSDTWGAAALGGRSHQGVDMLAPTGTPLVAVVSGSVQFKQNSLGGNAVWLAGNDGNRYYYAHLSSFEGSSRGVSQGEVIGYVGDTGNARGTPHLHFEVHPGGGAAVNPYPWVRNAGC